MSEVLSQNQINSLLAAARKAGQEMKMPKICAILGVSVGEKFKIRGFKEESVTFEILPDGTFRTSPANESGSTQALLRAIERPDVVYKVIDLLPEELRDICAIHRLFGDNWDFVARERGGVLCLRDYENEGEAGVSIGICSDLFPSLREGMKIRLDDYRAQAPVGRGEEDAAQ